MQVTNLMMIAIRDIVILIVTGLHPMIDNPIKIVGLYHLKNQEDQEVEAGQMKEIDIMVKIIKEDLIREIEVTVLEVTAQDHQVQVVGQDHLDITDIRKPVQDHQNQNITGKDQPQDTEDIEGLDLRQCKTVIIALIVTNVTIMMKVMMIVTINITSLRDDIIDEKKKEEVIRRNCQKI